MSKKQITIAAYLAGATTLAVSLPVMGASASPLLQDTARVTISQTADGISLPVLKRDEDPSEV